MVRQYVVIRERAGQHADEHLGAAHPQAGGGQVCSVVFDLVQHNRDHCLVHPVAYDRLLLLLEPDAMFPAGRFHHQEDATGAVAPSLW